MYFDSLTKDRKKKTDGEVCDQKTAFSTRERANRVDREIDPLQPSRESVYSNGSISTSQAAIPSVGWNPNSLSSCSIRSRYTIKSPLLSSSATMQSSHQQIREGYESLDSLEKEQQHEQHMPENDLDDAVLSLRYAISPTNEISNSSTGQFPPAQQPLLSQQLQQLPSFPQLQQENTLSLHPANKHPAPFSQQILQPPPNPLTSYGSSSPNNLRSVHSPSPVEDSHDASSRSPDEYSIHSNTQLAPILEIPEEIYQIRKSALQVLKPLTKTWVVITVGFALTVLFGTSRWTRLMPGLPFWFILLPAWASHAGLLLLHVQSAQNLSAFIAAANESRQRGDSRDHINRTEYLPLLQRSLKFGLKTGLLSFISFCFEILIYVRMAKSSIILAVTFIPLWILVAACLTDGMICKTQHWVRVLCWCLVLASMIMAVLKIDHHFDSLRWRTIISPLIVVLSIASGTLIYIVYGHQVGYYRLTESQLTAGNLYSLAALICMVLLIMIGEVIPLSRPVEIESRLFVVILAPLVISLVGMGAWVVSRDEFARLLLYGGQSTVHPMKLRWEARGWTCVQGRGVVVIPMFGEVTFQPLGRKGLSSPSPAQSRSSRPTEWGVELMTCCSGSCYPYEDEEEESVHLTEDLARHPYLDPVH